MIEYFIIPAALVGFLLTWMAAEQATLDRVVSAPALPDPAPELPVKVTKRRWF